MYEIKLRNGKVIEAINRKLQEIENQASILTFELLQNSSYFNGLEEFITTIDVWKDDIERVFTGRVIDIKKTMNSDGSFTCEVTCESAINFLNDTRVGKWDIHPDLYVPDPTNEDDLDPYRTYIQMTVRDLLQLVLNNHNAKVADDKKIFMGNITVEDTVYCSTDRETSLNCIQENLINKKGGYLEVRISGGIYYLHYISTPSITEQNLIELSINMNNITRQGTLKNIYTRLIPIGKDGLKINNVNEGLDYIEDVVLKARFGTIETVEIFENVTIAENLKTKAIAKLKELNLKKYSVECGALDLSCLHISSFSKFELSQPCLMINEVIPINEIHRIIKIDRDLDEEWNIGLNFSNEPPSSVKEDIKKQQEIKNINNSLSVINNALLYKTSEKKAIEIAENASKIESGTTINRPTTNLYLSKMYNDTTIDKLIKWNGTHWVDAMGTIV